jgi:hypothetical protein
VQVGSQRVFTKSVTCRTDRGPLAARFTVDLSADMEVSVVPTSDVSVAFAWVRRMARRPGTQEGRMRLR